MLRRTIQNNLAKWFKKPQRKPLIIKGARQVGKSFAVGAFAQSHNKKLHVINFQSMISANQIFIADLQAQTLIKKIEYILDTDINISQDILFLDEIQECPQAMNALKFFCEQMPQLAVIAAGSYLGIMSNESSFPVGKVEYLSMFPLTFSEFLAGTNTKLYAFYEEIQIDNMVYIDDVIHQGLLEYFYLYLAIGGMPEIIQLYIDLGNKPNKTTLDHIRKVQKNLLESYISDFAKHAGMMNATHILHVYRSIASQLAQSFDGQVDKFGFTHVIPNQKGYAKIIGPLTWLAESRLVIRNNIIHTPELPLVAQTQDNRFKLFFHDIGLLNAQLDTPISLLVQYENIGTYKGYIVENFVAMELFAQSDRTLYSFEKGESQIEFIVQHDMEIIPLEVKASHKSRRAKSLDSYISKYNPKKAYKVSTQNYGVSERGYTTLPLYCVGKLFS